MLEKLWEAITSMRTIDELCDALDNADRWLTLLEARDTLAKYVGDDWKTHRPTVDDTARAVVDVARTRHYAIVLIHWGSGSRTNIHNHPTNGAVIRVLEGRVTEERFTPMGDYGRVMQTGPAPHLETGATWALSNGQGTHRLSVGNQPATTMHIYLPGRQQCQSVWCYP